jgi:rhodanese-related sulfurtransferase
VDIKKVSERIVTGQNIFSGVEDFNLGASPCNYMHLTATENLKEQTDFFESKLRFEIDAFDLFTALSAGEKIVVIDTRKREAYKTEHIPGALSMPHHEINETTLADFDRDVLYVTYCQGIECNGSTKGALNMSRHGFRVKELVGGIAGWKLDSFATDGTNAEEGLAIECAC